jgi:hypothetical protein
VDRRRRGAGAATIPMKMCHSQATQAPTKDRETGEAMTLQVGNKRAAEKSPGPAVGVTIAEEVQRATATERMPEATTPTTATIEPTIKMHLIGSRVFGGVKPTSDWDAIIEDSEEARVWLRACGFIQRPNIYPLSTENVSYWRHNTLCSECFLVRSEPRRRLAREIIRKSRIFRIITNKPHRKRVWWALERCILELWNVYSEDKSYTEQRCNEPFRRRPYPLEARAIANTSDSPGSSLDNR